MTMHRRNYTLHVEEISLLYKKDIHGWAGYTEKLSNKETKVAQNSSRTDVKPCNKQTMTMHRRNYTLHVEEISLLYKKDIHGWAGYTEKLSNKETKVAQNSSRTDVKPCNKQTMTMHRRNYARTLHGRVITSSCQFIGFHA